MRLSSFVTDPLGRSATCSYNADDRLTGTTDRDGRRTTFSYDSGGRETGETWYDSSGQVTGHITFTYDNTGRMTGADDPNALLTFTYDSGGNQLTAATSGSGTGQPDVTLTSAYDGNNNRTSLADNLSTSNTITYDYDLANRMTTIGFSASTGSYAVAFGYDSGGNVTSVDRLSPSMFGLGNPTTTTIAYDAANRVTTMTDYSYTTSMSGGTTTPLATYLYGYDNANRVTSETDKEGLVTLSYDSGGQLLTARGSRTENYSYDSGGNRDMTGYTTGTGNELTSGGGYTFTYDNEGNMTGETQLSTGDGWTFGYDNRNRMVAAEEKNSGGTILSQVSYTYDAENRRIGEDVNGTRTWTVYDGQNAYADFNGSGALQHRYIMGAAVDEVLGRIDSSGNVAWYLTDRLGTVRDIVNTSGTVLDHVVYDSFGNIVTETNASSGDRFKFTGREYDAATGMYYYRARYYDPATGRFDEQDPMGFAAGDADLYRYTHNGPTDGADPSGLMDVTVFTRVDPYTPRLGGVRVGKMYLLTVEGAVKPDRGCAFVGVKIEVHAATQFAGGKPVDWFTFDLVDVKPTGSGGVFYSGAQVFPLHLWLDDNNKSKPTRVQVRVTAYEARYYPVLPPLGPVPPPIVPQLILATVTEWVGPPGGGGGVGNGGGGGGAGAGGNGAGGGGGPATEGVEQPVGGPSAAVAAGASGGGPGAGQQGRAPQGWAAVLGRSNPE